MQYNVSQLLKNPVGTSREYELEPDTLRLDAETSATVSAGHVRLDRTNTGILARGHVDATATLACSRCLEPAAVALAVDVAEEFEPAVDVTSGQPLPRPENDLIFRISQNHILDLGEALRQNLLASLPIQALCRPDCVGLCASCGANRNVAPCDCVVVDANHPFAALADLLKEGT